MTRSYFIGEESYIERLLQPKIYFELEAMECKALLDVIIIDHKNKTVQPADLKSTSRDIFNFQDTVLELGYHKQAAFYTLAVKEYIKQRALYDPHILNYVINPFKFIVVDSKQGSKYPAMIYKISPNDLKVGLYGGTAKYTNRYYSGIYQLLDDYKWHLENNQWLLPRKVYEAGGEVLLDMFN